METLMERLEAIVEAPEADGANTIDLVVKAARTALLMLPCTPGDGVTGCPKCRLVASLVTPPSCTCSAHDGEPCPRSEFFAGEKERDELLARAERAERDTVELAKLAMQLCVFGHGKPDAADCDFCGPWRERVAAIEDLHRAGGS